MQTLQLNLSIDEINIILEALGEQPYVKVSQIIGKIQQQASDQLQEPPQASAPDSEEQS